MADQASVVSWLTLGAAVLGTAASAFTAIWTTRRQDREVFDVHLDWEWMGSGPHAELPFVYIHNRSKNSISVVQLTWMFGAFARRSWQGTALFYEDPSDINFPYEIQAGSTRKLYLDEDGAKRSFEKIKGQANFYGIIRRSSLWLKVETMRGNSKLIPAESALPWLSRPAWVTGEKSDG